MKYKDFLDCIYERHASEIKLGLDRINNLMKEMDFPNKKLSGFHIAGTNGKGSTSAMCESLGLEYGYTTGLNTSPHLISYLERFRISKENLSEKEILTTFKNWQKVFEKHQASFFEITTAMAFYLFWQKKVNLAIFEVGLGGRLDATNVFAPPFSIITGIGYDHTRILGKTLKKIAVEKAGIIKENSNLIVGKMLPALQNFFKKSAEEKNSKAYFYGKDFGAKNIILQDDGVLFDYVSLDFSIKNLKVNMLGIHQAYNASVALKAFSLFLEKEKKALQEEKIREAFSKITWQGRMQIIHKSPLVIIDGAHNEQGIATLVKSINTLYKDKKKIFIISILKDKNLDKMFKLVSSIAHEIVLCKNTSKRAAEIVTQKEILQKYFKNFSSSPSVKEAYKETLSKVSKDDLIVICGSFYTISEILV